MYLVFFIINLVVELISHLNLVSCSNYVYLFYLLAYCLSFLHTNLQSKWEVFFQHFCNLFSSRLIENFCWVNIFWSKYQCLVPQVESDVGCPVATQLQRCLEARDNSKRHFLSHIPLQELESGVVHGTVRRPALHAFEVQERYHHRLATATIT